MTKKAIIIVIIILVLAIAALAIFLVLNNRGQKGFWGEQEIGQGEDLNMPVATGNVDDLIDSLEQELLNEETLIGENDSSMDEFVKTNDIGDIDQVSGEDEL